MTTKEMINVMEAFERGEEVQWVNAKEFNEDDKTPWRDTKIPAWDWDMNMYRIKPTGRPKLEPKFKVGDKIINKDYCEGEAITTHFIREINETIGDMYYFYGNGRAFIDQTDRYCININDCLWYFEYCDTAGVWRISTTRHKIEQFFGKSSTPIYELGARLPKE
ncbi:hypothetical protein [Campylobacter fetus]|uniref:hypothetical protein n=1 Tax=Campylobacter fetus TaxID=196 RepID=UPI000818857A|nr:hypothetical protein [Campylobacter fetus]OCR93837.1 hypothetical protein CFT12S02842_07785 [Campylobacter fetus subsp. testudinum]OCS02667.1 hypothetical protein CFTCF782_07710 [Campylobacter fetus subsp. testudinum]